MILDLRVLMGQVKLKTLNGRPVPFQAWIHSSALRPGSGPDQFQNLYTCRVKYAWPIWAFKHR